ncbi:MAG: GTP 3',8-cyclase MoaA, partial [Deefgea sp.]
MLTSTSVQPALHDRFGRAIRYLRLSVTDRCDLRCNYCLPKGFDGYEEPKNWLNFDEMTRLVGIFALAGVSRVRLTGGEPLLRRNLPELAARLAALPGVEDLSLSTNATQLVKHAPALKAAGVKRLNISLDSLDKGCINTITGRDSFDLIMAGIMAGKAAGFAPIKLNMVAMRGVNDHEIHRMVAFCLENEFILRLIEAMPMGDTGRNTQYLDLNPVREQLVQQYGLIPE